MVKKQIDISFILLLLIIFIFLGGSVAGVYFLNTDKLENEIAGNRPINTLLVLEKDQKPLCTFVLLYYPATRRSAIFDIAGETGLLLKKVNRVDRIDAVYDSHNVSQYVQEVERLLDLDVNYEIIFDLQNFGKAVDMLEGVTIFIPSEIEIYDGVDSVIFNSGNNNLDGDKAKLYVSYTDKESDVEAQRSRQDRFFSGFIKRLGENNGVLKNKDVMAVFSGLARTNMNAKAYSMLFEEWSKIDPNRINIQLVGGNYRDVSGKRLLIPYYDGSLIKDVVRQTLGSLTRGGNSERILTVEVLNGTNVSGLASRTAELIRSFGYEVIEIGNADRNDYEKTEIYDRSGMENEAKIFASVIKNNNIITENIMQPKDEFNFTNSEYKADFSLIIGKDFNGRYTQSR
ncbi:MAG: LCP family protein [Spirochaetaceae bacterium]|jgi:anionic cell wall polymer biosynthesis LytR-Cps2A-Psr (LCP) family protein|nr:LCP family protein [Spirochaetaceae bacterium]